MSKKTSYLNEKSLEKFPLSNKPTLIITQKLKQQIDFLHDKVGSSEWSGELITREIGTINDLDNWVIIAEDIWLADVGSPGFTGYEVDKGGFKAVDIIDMYEAFPGLLEGTHKNHHIHSHHSMAAFFSGTDDSNLEDRGSQSNYFMMLIVNFATTYVAKVAFKAQIKSGNGTQFHFSNNQDNFAPISLTKEKEREVLVVMDMEIKMEKPANLLTNEFTSRYESVKKALEEEEQTRRSTYQYGSYGYNRPYGTYPNGYHNYNKHRGGMENKQLNLGNWGDEDTVKPEDEYVSPLRGKKGRKDKKKDKSSKSIMSMTDKEYKQSIHASAITEFDQSHAKVVLNAIINNDFDSYNYGSVITALKQLDVAIPIIAEKRQVAEAMVDKIGECVMVMYPENSEPDQVISICNKIVELVEPFKNRKFIEIFCETLEDEIDLISFEEEADEEENKKKVHSITMDNDELEALNEANLEIRSLTDDVSPESPTYNDFTNDYTPFY